MYHAYDMISFKTDSASTDHTIMVYSSCFSHCNTTQRCTQSRVRFCMCSHFPACIQVHEHAVLYHSHGDKPASELKWFKYKGYGELHNKCGLRYARYSDFWYEKKFLKIFYIMHMFNNNDKYTLQGSCHFLLVPEKS